jgi:putative ABC transport system permease protein
MILFRVFDAFTFALERLLQHRVLVLWVLIGLSAASTLALSLTLYVDAVNSGLLASRLGDPPYAFRFRYVGAWEGNITQADVTSATAAVEETFIKGVGFPTLNYVQYARGGNWQVRREQISLGAFSLGMLDGAESQMEIVGGEWPPEQPAAGDPVPVLLPESAFYSMGVQVGDILTAVRPGADPLEIEVAALWRPLNEKDPAWIFPPTFFNQVMLTTPESLWPSIAINERPVEEVAWYINFDGAQIQTADVSNMLSSTVDGQRGVSSSLPGAELDLSPVSGLEAFIDEVTELRQQLIVMLLPVAGLVLYFVSLVAGLLVGRQGGEDAILRSRGMSRAAVLRNHVLMWFILAAAALGIGVVLSPYVVRLVGQTTSFLRFDNKDEQLIVILTPNAVLTGAFTSLLAASSGLFLAWRSSRQTITSYRAQNARQSQAWWQRVYLDIILMIPAVYVLYTLDNRGGIRAEADNPFADPLTFLGPSLFALGMTLFFLRMLPFILRIAARFIALTNSIPLLMALRELTRSTGRYRGALLMMCLTLSLTGFMASMASTLDRSLKDSVDYQTGADLVLITAQDAQTETAAGEDGAPATQTVTGFNALPPEDLLQIDGVTTVSRVGRFTARLEVPGRRVDGIALGVDRAAMAAVTRARDDYAPLTMADTFNLLAGNRTGVILNAQTAAEYNLLIGQEVNLQIFALEEWYDTTVPIVGVVDYFPTLDPNAGFFLITNLDPLLELVGTSLPHNYWVSLEPGTDAARVRDEALEMGYPVIQWRDSEARLREAQTAPARRGVFGFLSVGFIASIVLTLIVAVVQSTASFQAQSAQLGSLRAMGLSSLAVGMYLIFSQGLAALSGILGGTLIGLATTQLYLPLLDFSNGLPPYLIRVAWGDIYSVYAIFAAILLTVILSTTFFMSRQRLSTVVKLGDA